MVEANAAKGTAKLSHRVDRMEMVTLQTRYSGVIAAMVTPCSAPGIVDSLATERLCANLAKHGCNGVFIASSTGESLFLDEADRRILTVAARKALTQIL